MVSAYRIPKSLARRRTRREYIIGGITVLVMVGFCIFVFLYWQEFIKFSKYGYIGIFVLSLISGFLPMIPVPDIVFVFALGAVLVPVYIGLLAGLGESIGSMGVYVTGYSSARAFHALDHGVMSKFRDWMKTRGSFSVFAMSAIFNPLFYPFTVIAGMMHFGWWRFFLLMLAGKSLKNVVVAYAGYFGVKALLDLVGGHLPI